MALLIIYYSLVRHLKAATVCNFQTILCFKHYGELEEESAESFELSLFSQGNRTKYVQYINSVTCKSLGFFEIMKPGQISKVSNNSKILLWK